MKSSSKLASLSRLLVFLFLALQYTNGTDTLEQGQSITFSKTLISGGERFELGFFSPRNSSREYPFLGNSSIFAINRDGNIVISDGKISYMLTNRTTGGNTFARLLDSGNLILQDRISLSKNISPKAEGLNRFLLFFSVVRGSFPLLYDRSEVLWQSFDYPSDTILPGMKLGMTEDMEFNAYGWFRSGNNTVTWGLRDSSRIMQMVLDVFGQLKLQTWCEGDQRWYNLESSKCSYHRCGVFSICNMTADTPCRCLKGFKPISCSALNEVEKSKGCERITNLQCSNGGGDLGFFGCLLKEYLWKKFYLKLAVSDLVTIGRSTNGTTKVSKDTGNSRQLWAIVTLTISLSMLSLGLFIYCVCRTVQQKGEDLLKFDLALIVNGDERDL
ncbi:G-type lectin S-receptor-like serine/threonine-protein kinase At2g19130 [Durio zibethinus]|uniref:G-type lectin S-receptor-like serine/threonine-protein kinase At2g19130 n=1 Tax=Durio zibethinus TaxID=66656 RepID=A0A6P5ZLE7_DURZI|nr:G-type lectin S-receptor-like serine/threonine-protein kinase At2g19130 [Durio zibethinus]